MEQASKAQGGSGGVSSSRRWQQGEGGGCRGRGHLAVVAAAAAAVAAVAAAVPLYEQMACAVRRLLVLSAWQHHLDLAHQCLGLSSSATRPPSLPFLLSSTALAHLYRQSALHRQSMLILLLRSMKGCVVSVCCWRWEQQVVCFAYRCIAAPVCDLQQGQEQRGSGSEEEV
jgi:hypothetical protein